MDTIEKALEKLARQQSRLVDAASAPAVAEAPRSDAGAVRPTPARRTRRSVTLDLVRIRDAGMVVPDGNRGRIKEEYRAIKRPLLMNAAGKGAAVRENSNVIMVTSAQPGEGKTFTAINLALSIASERDRTVLLVDADVLKPTVSRFFGVDQQPGLVDYLIDDGLDLADVLVETNVPSLMLLPAGNSHHLSTELLASDNMRALAREMSQRYSDRMVIMDSPPLLATTEAAVLAHLVGQVVMVVEAGQTRQTMVKEALALLDPDMTVGFVLNKAQPLAGGYYYGGYYYGYGYGYGSYGAGRGGVGHYGDKP